MGDSPIHFTVFRQRQPTAKEQNVSMAGFGIPTCFSGSHFPVSFQLLDS